MGWRYFSCLTFINWRRVLAPAFLLLAAFALPVAASDHPLGRLFYSPEQRAALERQRGNKQARQDDIRPSAVTVDGVVRRSDGRATVWINGIPYNERAGTAKPDPSLHGKVRLSGADGEVTLTVGENVSRAAPSPTGDAASNEKAAR